MPVIDHPALTALEAVLQDAAERLETPAHALGLELMEARVWPDRGLGLPGSRGGRALTPGYLVRLSDGSTYRTDRQGTVRLEPEGQADVPHGDVPTVPERPDHIRLRYTVEGGIGGWRTSFETDSDQLSEEDEAELRRLLTEADFFFVPEGTGYVVPDGITRRLWVAVGRRDREVVRGDGIEVEDTEAFHALVAWVAERTPPLLPTPTAELS